MAANALDPLEIFPLPVWESVLEQLRKEVGSSRDVLNCSKVCTEFERILEPTKQEWLFGSICPFILPYLKGSELLACRRICKNWRRGVDTFLEDFETWRPFDEGNSDISRSIKYDPLREKRIKWRNFRNEDALETFLEAMKKQEMKTPFVGRSVCLGDWGGYQCRGGTGSEFFKRVLEVLSLYGDHIWHLRFASKESIDFSSCEFYQILKEILDCTPNLKCLAILDGYSDWSDSVSESDSVKSSDSFKAEQKRFTNLPLEDNPLPEIIALETLDICATYRRNPAIVILKKLMNTINLGNLKCLKLHHFEIYSYKAKPFAVVTPLQHLTEFHASGICWDDLEHIFNNMISPTAPLGKLVLSFQGVFDSEDDEIDFDRLCDIINRWKGTLRMLAIYGFRHASYKKPKSLEKSLSKLDVPNLKSLELQGLLFEIGCLPPALTASLEYLRIRYDGTFEEMRTEFSKCVFEVGGLENSPIWVEMKKLKVVRVQSPPCEYSHKCKGTLSSVCTREMYERGIKANLDLINTFDSDDEVDDDDDDNIYDSIL